MTLDTATANDLAVVLRKWDRKSVAGYEALTVWRTTRAEAMTKILLDAGWIEPRSARSTP